MHIDFVIWDVCYSILLQDFWLCFVDVFSQHCRSSFELFLQAISIGLSVVHILDV